MNKTLKSILLAVLILVPTHAFAAVSTQDSNKFLNQNIILDHNLVVKEEPMSDLDTMTDEGG
jgi:hypothetical protein